MPLYEARRLLTTGNPIDGYDVNDTRPLGEIYIRPEANRQLDQGVNNSLLDLLAEKDWIGRQNVEVVETDMDGQVTIYLAEEAYVGINADGEYRFLAMVDPTPARSVREADRRRAAAVRLLEDGEQIAVDNGGGEMNPILQLDPQVLHGGELVNPKKYAPGGRGWSPGTFWEHIEKYTGMERRIFANYDSGRVGFQIEVWDLDSPVGEHNVDRFEYDIAELQPNMKAFRCGFDPHTSEPVVLGKRDMQNLLVALDRELEKR